MKTKNIVMNLVIGALAVVFAAALFSFCREMIDYGRTYTYKEQNFLYSLEEKNYTRMVEMMYDNETAGVLLTPTYKECYAIARYYEAATYYKAYLEAGDEVRAAGKKEIMNEQLSYMGELSYAAEDIKKELGLE